jgi:hypothetical protein
MRRFLLICLILITAGSLVAQTPTVADLTTTSGSNIKWYSASTGGSALATSTVLVNGTTYYASQTINGVESTSRLDVTATVAPCITAPSITTNTVTNIGITSATFNGNITNTNGANVTTRGFKYSTTDGFNPASAGTNISETGTYTAGTFNLSPSGLSTTTTYYVVAYAANSVGTTYGDQVSYNTLIQTDYSYTGATQTMTIPIGITQLTLMVWGAQGASSFNPGGKGGYAIGYLAVTPGQTITLVVGGQPAFNNASGYHTGGWPDGGQGWYNGQSGGGSSYVMYGGSKVIVAGGGGGANVFDDTPGAGGGTNGGNASSGGGGGTQSGGGTANTVNASAGSLGQGGYAGQGNNNGGGGGGGYYGGGGAENGVGGGGSAYTGGVTSGSATAGQQTGNGRILISY